MSFSRLAGIFLMSLFFCACDKRTDKETAKLTSYSSLRDQVVKRAEKGELTANSAGVISLPSELKTVSNDAHAYISKDVSAGLMVAFNVSINPNRKEFLLYAERGLPKDVKAVHVGPLNLTVAGKGEDHWYRTIAHGS